MNKHRGRRTTHWSEAQRQVVLWYREVVGAHEGLEGTAAMAACIAHRAKRSIRVVGGTVQWERSSREETSQTPEEGKGAVQ